jgi:hypothetical protein
MPRTTCTSGRPNTLSRDRYSKLDGAGSAASGGPPSVRAVPACAAMTKSYGSDRPGCNAHINIAIGSCGAGLGFPGPPIARRSEMIVDRVGKAGLCLAFPVAGGFGTLRGFRVDSLRTCPDGWPSRSGPRSARSAARPIHPRRGRPFPAAGRSPRGRVASNILRADYAGSDSCAGCHADIYKAWRESPMRRMTRVPGGADIHAPFDAGGGAGAGATFPVQGRYGAPRHP